MIKKILKRGLLSIVPLALSIWLIYSMVYTLDMLGTEMLNFLNLKSTLKGSGFFVIFIVLLLVGGVFSFSPTQWLYALLEKQLMKFPVVKTIYGAIKDVTSLLAGSEEQQQKRTVLVRQANGGFMLGFVTNEHLPEKINEALPKEEKWVVVLYPLSYQMAGITTLVKQSDILPVDWDFESAMKFMLTAGISK